MRNLTAVVCLALGQIANAAPSCGGHGDASTMVVTTAWLAEHLKDPNLVILAVGDKKEYDAGHIPGSQFINLMDVSLRKSAANLTLELPSASDLAEKLGNFGISNQSRVVLYPTKDWFSPTSRIYLTLDAMGMGARTSLLDAGFPAWQKEGRAVTSEVPVVKPAKFEPCVQNDVVVDLDFVRTNLHHQGTDLLDVRDSEAAAPFYAGERTPQRREGMDEPRTGHIPGARSLPFELLIDESGHLKPRAELQALFDGAGVKRGDRVVSYCWVGQRATFVYFVARYLGYDARLYDGSWEEWNRHTELPVEVAKNK